MGEIVGGRALAPAESALARCRKSGRCSCSDSRGGKFRIRVHGVLTMNTFYMTPKQLRLRPLLLLPSNMGRESHITSTKTADPAAYVREPRKGVPCPCHQNAGCGPLESFMAKSIPLKMVGAAWREEAGRLLWKWSARESSLTTQWSGRPTAQALFSYVASYLWAAAHRER